MKCDNCDSPAYFHLTHLEVGESELHLCKQCHAAEQNKIDHELPAKKLPTEPERGN